jgi:hypothetical protein
MSRLGSHSVVRSQCTNSSSAGPGTGPATYVTQLCMLHLLPAYIRYVCYNVTCILCIHVLCMCIHTCMCRYVRVYYVYTCIMYVTHVTCYISYLHMLYMVHMYDM